MRSGILDGLIEAGPGMNIQGIQKLTLLDYPGRVACTLFTGGCNFRCPFCQNGGLVLEPQGETPWSCDSLFAFLKKRAGVLDGVCITGGEPLLQPEQELMELLRDIRGLGYAVKLDTNGSRPDRLARLVEKGLVDYVAMDVKNCRERYRETAGLPESYDLRPVEESIRYLLGRPLAYEFRTTVVREYHRPQDIEELGHLLAGAERYFLQAYVDSERVLKQGLHAYGAQEMRDLAERVRPYVPAVQVRGV